jgi:diacylglycerol kinase (ATP)
MEPGLTDWWCCWCQRCVHEACKPVLSEVMIYEIEYLLSMIPLILSLATSNGH